MPDLEKFCDSTCKKKILHAFKSVSQSNVTCIFSILLTSKADVCVFIL